MSRRNHIMAAGACLGMLLLILDSRCALESAQQGLELCIRTVIPSLFPFLFLSGLITASLWGNSRSLLRPAAKAVFIPSGAESLFLPGFLGGYPAGAAAIGSAFRTGHLSRDTANRLLAFCSNAGPAFLFGMIAPQFPEKWMAWGLWGIHILSSAMAGAVYSPKDPIRCLPDGKNVSVKDTMQTAVQITGMICGWILLFRILIGFLDRWILWLLPDPVRILIWGLLELSNGCCALKEITNVSLRFVTAAVMVSFGGLCVAMQTASVIPGLSMRYYGFGKLLQTLFSILLAAAVIQGAGIFLIVIGAVLLILPKRNKKRGSNPKPSVV